MAVEAQGAADQAAGAAQNFTDQMGDHARRTGEAMRASGEKATQQGAQLGLKLLEQAEQNTGQAFAAMRAAAQAKDVSEVMRIQTEFMRDQSARAMGQAREIGELIVQFGRDVVAPLRG